LAHAPDLHVLATSQRPLGTEPLLSLQPLAVDDAVDLFWERAAARDPGQDAPVRELVRRLDCLPLAVELAAVRTNLSTPTELLALLDYRFRLLRRGDDTLATAIAWSWDLLEPSQARALGQLSLFAGGFDVTAASAVLALDASEFAPDLLDGLVARSLVQTRRDPKVRLELLESIRAYAAHQLQDQVDRLPAETRHAAHYLHQGEAWLAGLQGPGRAECLAGLEREQENLLAVCRRGARLGPDVAVRAALCVDAVFLERRPASARVALWDGVGLGPDTQPALGVRARWRHAEAQRQAGQVSAGHAGLQQALDMAVAQDLPVLAARVRCNLGAAFLAVGRFEESRALLVAALEQLDRHGQPWGRFLALVNLATLDWCCGHAHDAEDRYADALALSRAVGHRRGQGLALGYLGNVRLQLGALDGAAAAFRDAIQVLAELDDPRGRAAATGNLGSILLEQGELDQAQSHLEEASALCRRVGEVRMEAVFVGNLGISLLFRGQPAQALGTFERARALQDVVGPDPRGRATLLGYVAIAQAAQDRPEAAIRALERSRVALPDPGVDEARFLALCAAHAASGPDAELLRIRAVRDAERTSSAPQDARLALALLRRRLSG
jgi:tetratricopeptide (TPR) repeat protein